MSRHENPFKFKKFQVSHHRSSIKIGFDAVTLGAWVKPVNIGNERSLNILDVGCGCGVIAMMMAQRYPHSKVTGIDIDKASIEECIENFRNCDWADRLSIEEGDFIEYARTSASKGIKFDCIISNPPYLSAGLKKPATPRLIARHQSDLNPINLVTAAKEILTSEGIIAIVIPTEQVEELLEYCKDIELVVKRMLIIRDRADSLSKRTLIEFGYSDSNIPVDQKTLIVRNSDGDYTNEYKKLCQDFFLKF